MSHELQPHCIVCGCKLPHLPRAEAIEKGAAFTIKVDNGPERTYYRCIGRHTSQECMQAIGMVPKFSKATSLLVHKTASSAPVKMPLGKIPTHQLLKQDIDWGGARPLKDGEPCNHPGCLSHVSHPCEGCGRIGGRR